jgi:thiamine-monophosphate kinase
VNEFALIERFFAAQPVARADVVLGIGDDAALTRVPPGQELALTTDTLVAGVHFLADAEPADLGYRALAVNLSDLAAMGAEPAWFLLNLTLPVPDERWLTGFCAGLYELARAHGAQLVGGNTARGPLNIGITAAGLVPAGAALTRRGALAGDRVYVTGELGDAALALRHRLGVYPLAAADFAAVRPRLDRPTARVAQGLKLRGLASAAIDVSDGLLADLGHVLAASGVGARLELARLPLSATYRAHLNAVGWEPALAHGDDYELCFTVPAARVAAVEALRPQLGCRLSAIGEIVAAPGLALLDPAGRPYRPRAAGHDHFAQ